MNSNSHCGQCGSPGGFALPRAPNTFMRKVVGRDVPAEPRSVSRGQYFRQTIWAVIGWLAWVTASPATPELVRELIAEQDFRSAALEWRRLGRAATEPHEQAGYLWASAYTYWLADSPQQAEHVLDQAESAWSGIETPQLWLRARIEEQRRDWRGAEFYWAAVERGAADEPDLQTVARRHRAALAFRQGEIDTARERLQPVPAEKVAEAQAAVDQFVAGRDKRPWLGGVLGLIPGMGYAYAGEYANAFRSFILNSLFIYGMVDTARNDHWGGFAVITFFEITWYTGSVYGGIDASHRYNQRRRETVLEALTGEMDVSPRWESLPIISLQYEF